MDIVLYSTGCPKCNVLKDKLNSKDVQYKENNSVSDMLALGIVQAPTLSIDGEMLDFFKANDWVNSYQLKEGNNEHSN